MEVGRRAVLWLHRSAHHATRHSALPGGEARRRSADVTLGCICATILARFKNPFIRSPFMQLSVGLIWLGALLVLAGVVYTAANSLSRGRMSEARGRGEASADHTLEPPRGSRSLSLKANWAGITLIAVGFLLLLSGAFI
jgi:uncharacterized membrane protein